MRHPLRLLGALTIAFLAFALPAAAVPDQGKGKDEKKAGKGTAHDLRSPMQKRYDAALQKGLEAKLKGKASGKVHRANGQYVQLERTGEDRVFVVIAEFGNTRHVSFPDNSPLSTAITFEGPLHNAIPEPDRNVDNSTLWQSDYNRAHYENMYFNRMAKYYETQSSGRYSVNGDVTEWVKVPFNEARYGRSGDTANIDPAVCSSIVCNNTWFLIRDAMAIWVADQLKTKSMAEIQSYLKTFDVQDRYDSNEDGNFAEPDGFIDHFQIVHAGGDEAAGDDQQGTDAIWSHRWYANIYGGGPGGLPGVNIGGVTPIPNPRFDDPAVTLPNNPTGIWVGDYTIQPENGGLGVFAHEFGHDLGLPDLYDTSGNTGGAENSTGFWTLMSSGANIGDGGPDGIGDDPTDLGAWEKFQLGWLGGADNQGVFYEVGQAGQRSEHKLGPNDAATKQAQALFVVLPDKSRENVITAPKTGSYAYWSGAGDNLSNRMTKAFTLAPGAVLTADLWYDTEPHFDYFFVEASTNGGTTWLPIETNLSEPATADLGTFNQSGTGIAGSSGGVYRTMTTITPLPAGNVQIRFRYETDTNTGGKGVVIDNIAITGQAVDGAEDEAVANAWTFEGFLRIKDGIGITTHFNAYVAENRQYDGYDTSLRTAYNFGFLDSRPNWVEHFPYQDGLLVSYWDTSESNNNVGDHPGSGLILPVDAHPTFHHHPDGHLIRPRILTFDSTFGLEPTDAITINKNSQPVTIASKPAVPVFDDTKTYWFNADEHAATGAHVGRYQPGWYSVNVPKTGTTIRVKSQTKNGFMQVQVNGGK